jgi:hypothetical protein
VKAVYTSINRWASLAKSTLPILHETFLLLTEKHSSERLEM